VRRFLRPVAAALVCSFAAAASGCVNRDTAVATPAALLHREAVPLGSAADVTLRFHVPSNAAFPAGTHRVLMRLLFDDGNVMASYDHDPPVPMEQWEPGKAITYTRRMLLPEVPYVGDVPLVVGLASSSGTRLLLTGKDVGDRMYEVATVKLHAERTLLVHEEGWHRREGPPTETGHRWTHAKATMTFRNPRRDSVLHVRLSGQPDVFPVPPHVSILIGERVVQRVSVTSSETDYEVALNAAAFGADDDLVLTFAVDETFVPALVGRGVDRRELGFRVHHVFLDTR
jgi:hypothetical protein